jgi:hypothetical protein
MGYKCPSRQKEPDEDIAQIAIGTSKRPLLYSIIAACVLRPDIGAVRLWIHIQSSLQPRLVA